MVGAAVPASHGRSERRPLLDRCGKWVFLPRGCVSAAEARLACVGPLAFFIARVVPFLRIYQFRGCRPHSAALARGPAMRAPGLAGLGVEIPLRGVALDKSQDLTMRSWDVPLGLEAFAAFALLGSA